jgi:GcrA cell cycle regulator
MSAKRATWSSERIELMKRCYQAGLSCSQIAGEIGVSRNAVIGKLHRLGLSQPRDIAARQVEQRRAARLAQAPRMPSRPKRPRLGVSAQQALLMEAFPTPPAIEDVPIHNGRGCTLLELGQERCRWPISTPGAKDFYFCGNEPLKGLPYCAGHARIAYRPSGRPRSGVPA